MAGAADSNGDGVQGALHRRHAHHAEGNLGSSTNLAARLLGSADSDGDGALSVGEIQGALGSSAASGAGDAQTAAIAKLDTDSDGKLSDAELTAGIDAFRAAHHRGGSGSASQSPPAQAVTA